MGNIPDNWLDKVEQRRYLRCVICDYCQVAPSNYVDVSGHSENPEKRIGHHYNDPGKTRSVSVDSKTGEPLCSQCRGEAWEAANELWFMDGGNWSTSQLDTASCPGDNMTRIQPEPVKDDDYYARRLLEIEAQRSK